MTLDLSAVAASPLLEGSAKAAALADAGESTKSEPLLL